MKDVQNDEDEQCGAIKEFDSAYEYSQSSNANKTAENKSKRKNSKRPFDAPKRFDSRLSELLKPELESMFS